MVVTETSLVKKNHQIASIVHQKIAQPLIKKQPMTHIAKRLAISTSTVIHKLNEFQFKTDWDWLPENMSWDEYHFKKGKMNFMPKISTHEKSSPFSTDAPRPLSETTFNAIPEKLETALKSSQWTCLALITTSPEAYFQTLRLSLIAFTLCNISVVL